MPTRSWPSFARPLTSAHGLMIDRRRSLSMEENRSHVKVVWSSSHRRSSSRRRQCQPCPNGEPPHLARAWCRTRWQSSEASEDAYIGWWGRHALILLLEHRPPPYMPGQPTINNLMNLNRLLKEAKQSCEWSLAGWPLVPFTRWTSMERRSWFTQIAAGQMPRTWNRRPVSACSAPVSLWTPWMAMLQAYLTGDPIGSRGSAVRLWRQRLWQWTLAWTPGSFAGSSWARCWSRATSPLHTSGRLPSDFLPVIGVTDCRSLYDLLVKDGQPSTTLEKRLTIDINGLKEAAMEFDPEGEKLKEVFRWVATESQVADHLTKVKPAHLLRDLLDRGWLKLVKIESSIRTTFKFWGVQFPHTFWDLFVPATLGPLSISRKSAVVNPAMLSLWPVCNQAPSTFITPC